MRKTTLLGMAAITGLFSLVNCTKNDGESTGGAADKPTIDGKNPMEIMMMQPWLFTKSEDSSTSNGTWESSILPCETDDVYTFKANGVLSVDEGTKDCDPGLPQVYNSIWSKAVPTDKKVSIHGIQWDITVQTNTQMVFEREYFGTGDVFIIRQTFQRKD